MNAKSENISIQIRLYIYGKCTLVYLAEQLTTILAPFISYNPFITIEGETMGLIRLHECIYLLINLSFSTYLITL